MVLIPWISNLIQDLALLISIVLLYDYFWVRDSKPRKFHEKLLAGIVVGIVSVIVMSDPWVMQNGLFFDIRTVLLSVAGLFLGAVPAFVALIIAASYRFYLGGIGVYMGIITIVSSGLLGILWHKYRKSWWQKNRIYELVALGYLVHLIMFVSILTLPSELALKTFRGFLFPGLTIYPWAIVLLALLMNGRVQNWKSRRKRIELESMYISLVEHMPAGVFRKDKEGRFVYVNDVFCQLKGLKSEEIIGKLPREVYEYEYMKDLSGGYDSPPVQRTLQNQGEEHHQRILSNGLPITVDEVYPQTDGSVKYFKVVKTPILDESGAVIGSQGMQFDITSTHLTEIALMQEQYLMSTFLDNSNDCIFFKDASSRFLRVNKTQLKFLGATDDREVVGKTDFDFFSRIYAQKALEDELSIMNSGKPIYNLEERVTWIDNRQMWMITSKFPFVDRDGNVVGTFGVAKDITPQKKLEGDLLDALNKVEESDRLKTAFLHNISHEIRTPMNSIIGFSNLLKDDSIDLERKGHMADIVIKSSNQLLSIIDDIVRIATIEAGQERLNESPVNLNNLLSFEFEKFQKRAEEASIDFQFKLGLSDKLSNVVLDETKFVQTLSNLLVNAFKFTKQGHIHFGYELNGQMLQFYVEDSGIGIPIEKQEEIFNRFSQVDNLLTRQYGGSGLGLSICKAYVELMGGKISVLAAQNEGSRFVFTLPYIPYNEELVTKSSIRSKADDGILTNGQTILIAEDEAMNFYLLQEMLQVFDLKIIHAENGLEAYKAVCANEDISLVLMDLKMPVMDGFEATRLICDVKPAIPVIALTAYSQDGDRNKALECGCKDLIVKPIDRKLLYKNLNYYLNLKKTEL